MCRVASVSWDYGVVGSAIGRFLRSGYLVSRTETMYYSTPMLCQFLLAPILMFCFPMHRPAELLLLYLDIYEVSVCP